MQTLRSELAEAFKAHSTADYKARRSFTELRAELQEARKEADSLAVAGEEAVAAVSSARIELEELRREQACTMDLVAAARTAVREATQVNEALTEELEAAYSRSSQEGLRREPEPD